MPIPKKRSVRKKTEEKLQISVCNYLRLQYPHVIFNCDVASGIRLSIGQAVTAKKMRSSKGMPDMMILHPHKGFHGLFVELKKQGTSLYLKDGVTPVSDEHIREQLAMRDSLNALGYKAVIAVGFDQAKEIIDEYMGKG